MRLSSRQSSTRDERSCPHGDANDEQRPAHAKHCAQKQPQQVFKHRYPPTVVLIGYTDEAGKGSGVASARVLAGSGAANGVDQTTRTRAGRRTGGL
jgi:hypothetical protein